MVSPPASPGGGYCSYERAPGCDGQHNFAQYRCGVVSCTSPRLVASCLNPSCRHEGLIDVSNFPNDVEVQSFAKKVMCAKCGARGRHIDVRPNWKEQLAHESLTGKVRR